MTALIPGLKIEDGIMVKHIRERLRACVRVTFPDQNPLKFWQDWI